jgi:hypothetical protein
MLILGMLKFRLGCTHQQHWTGLTGVRRRSSETSKRRTRVRIARLASRLSKFEVVGHPSDGAMTDFRIHP